MYRGLKILHVRIRTFVLAHKYQLYVPVIDNDPSAGSPTETLLRLLLPLDEQICMTLGNRSTTEVVSRPLSERLIDSSNR